MTTQITWTCAECKNPIRDHQGNVGADAHAAGDYLSAAAEAPSGGTAAALMAGPRPTRWEAYHHDCIEEDTRRYEVGVQNLRTYQQLAAATGHLMEKAWFAGTDWKRILLAKAGSMSTL
ncbi:hypothetical protein QE364_000792 [Nocardioides zeae]|uniref:Uncharacterized protein n=1 Tax=Nocardioides zeae TaxID=1457234 RepID=A0ACC6IES5_9ACTN|nr:hypothetical protein [Nocardioides zeae]MDR6174295.1 hypothetical protein [Nocardioides zeae]MDR6209100.1 hypothetical protein [Nocardioides zeae]